MLELPPKLQSAYCGAGNIARSRLSGGSGRIRTISKFLSTRSQPRLHRILRNISPNTIELRTRSDQMVVAFIPPKWPMDAQKKIGLVSRKSLERPQPFCGQQVRRSQKMDMIRHHDKGMQLVAMQFAFPVPQCRHHHLRNFRPPQEQRTSSACVQQPVDRYKSLACRNESGRREHPMSGKTAMQPEGDEQGLLHYVKMGQPPLIMPHTSSWCIEGGEILRNLWGGQSCPQPAFSRLRPPERRLRPGLAAPQFGQL